MNIRPIEAWHVPVGSRQSAKLVVGLVTERLQLKGAHALWYEADQPAGEVDPDARDTVWLRSGAATFELAYSAAYQLRAQRLRVEGVQDPDAIEQDAAAWANDFMRAITAPRQ